MTNPEEFAKALHECRKIFDEVCLQKDDVISSHLCCVSGT